MRVVTGMVSGLRTGPELAEQAVRNALEEAGLKRADQVILLLSRDFGRHPQAAILAAARTAGTTQISGCTASGLMTERGWQMDQPAAAALVFTHDTAATPLPGAPLLCFSGQGNLPYDWQGGPARFGLLDSDAATWTHGRLAENACSDVPIPGISARMARSNGLRTLGPAQTVNHCEGYDLRRIGGQRAIDNLLRCLPAALREYPPLHLIAGLRRPEEPGIAILSANSDGSLTLSAALNIDDTLAWAIRQPLSAEQEMRQTLAAAASSGKPDFALMFSCIGRGPVFYGDEDRDWLALREQFPDVPLLGAYGCGQIAPAGGRNCLFQNSVITLLAESAHVQSLP